MVLPTQSISHLSPGGTLGSESPWNLELESLTYTGPEGEGTGDPEKAPSSWL